MSKHQGTVLYESTDNLLRSAEFEKLCSGVMSTEMVPVVTQQLINSSQLAKTQKTEFGCEVIKLSPVKAKGLKVTDVDVGIIRYVLGSGVCLGQWCIKV